jgi:hypothetical protein
MEISPAEIGLGFFLGAAASFGVWWIVTHFFVPKITFSHEIARYTLPSGDEIWLCQIKNSGRREIIDLEIVVRMAIIGFQGTEDTAYHTYKTNASRVPRLKPGKARKVRLFDTREDLEFIDAPSRSIRRELQRARTLNDMLALGEDAYITVHVFAHDSFGGAKKVFSSDNPPYRVTHIRRGTIRNMNVVRQESPWMNT